MTIPEPSERTLELAREYHRRTEAFDQTVCSFRTPKGVAVPINIEELGECGMHARHVYRELLQKSGASPDEWQVAVFRTARIDYP